MALSLALLFLTAMFMPFFYVNGQNPDIDRLSTTRPEVQKEIVDVHNIARRNASATNMLKMGWNSLAEKNARKWAQRCIYEHSKGEDRMADIGACGENLFMSSVPSTWSEAIQSWDNEKYDFTYGVGPKSPQAMVGHYTQVVWFSSYQVGCAVAYCANQALKYFYVCQYCPAGNIQPRLYTPFEQGKPCARCPGACDNGLCTNSCEYVDNYSNCDSLKAQVSCNHPLVKKSCKASCNCQGKIY